jgi:hypothetical protein
MFIFSFFLPCKKKKDLLIRKDTSPSDDRVYHIHNQIRHQGELKKLGVFLAARCGTSVKIAAYPPQYEQAPNYPRLSLLSAAPPQFSKAPSQIYSQTVRARASKSGSIAPPSIWAAGSDPA